MKWTLIIGSFFVFGYFLAPVIFKAMKKSDFDNLYHGMQNAKVAAGSYQGPKKGFRTYEDKLIYGQ